MTDTVLDKDRYRIVAACLVYRLGSSAYEYLILKRRDDLKVYPGLWTVPAGGLEKEDIASEQQCEDSPLHATARREVRQESGVEVGCLEYLSNFVFERPDGVPVFGVRYAAPYLSGEARFDPEDSTDLRWITAAQTGQYAFLGTIAEEIREFDRRWLDNHR